MRYLIFTCLIIYSGFCVGKEFPPEDVNQIKSLTKEQASVLVTDFKGPLHLDGLTLIDKEVAHELAKHKGSLYLNGLASIDKEAARELAKFTGNVMYLESLTSISEDVAKELVNIKGPKIVLNIDLASVDPNAAKLLSANPEIRGLMHKKHSLPPQASAQLPLRHQRCVTGFCSVTCASIVLDYTGLQIPPQTFHKMTGGSPFFIDLCRAASRLGRPWSEQHFANNPDGFTSGMNLIRTLLVAKRPVIVDLSSAFETNGSHVYVVCGFSDEQNCVFILDPHFDAPGIRKLSYIEFSRVWNSLGIVGRPSNIRSLIAMR